MIVNNLLLPQLLQELIEQGRWKRPVNVAMLEAMTGSQHGGDFTFLDIRGMQRESYPVHLVEDDRLAKVYHLASSKISGKPVVDNGILDIDKSIFIAVNWSEEAICLDYRFSYDNPRIIASVLEGSNLSKWKIVTPDFDSFVSKLNL
jgi:hypothetical protein